VSQAVAESILIADDNQVDRTILSKIVVQSGYSVIQAKDGVEALELYAEHNPRIVLLDALMPRMDGFEVAREIKNSPEGEFTSVVFLTSLTAADELASCVNAGGDDFLSKPYNKVILQAKLRALQRIQDLHSKLQQQSDQLRKLNVHMVQEQEAAKAMFDNVVTRGFLDAPYINYFLSPLAVFNGDVLMAAPTPRETLMLLLGDFTGHGLTASIGAMPLSEIFYGMSQKGFSVSDIVHECNRKLHSILPIGYFCCAIVAELDFRKQTINYWNGGLPPGYLIRPGSDVAATLESEHLPLGVLPSTRISVVPKILEAHPGDRLVLSTDGIIEAQNLAGEQFGYERFAEQIKGPGDNCIEHLLAQVQQHMGEQSRDDDFTMAEITMQSPETAQVQFDSKSLDGELGADVWGSSYEIRDCSLKQFNPLPMLVRVMMHCPSLNAHVGDLQIVLSELYSNALEHGVLGLDSTLKGSAEGFQEYYEQRALQLESIDGYVRFEFECDARQAEGSLIIRVTDSGQGFDFQQCVSSDSEKNIGYYGRGLSLLTDLCHEVKHEGLGNTVCAEMRWETGH
jgi:CheY-like chemotaxis protein/anti-sigma regulatory factor (Ser/Thr protein kinase)